MLDFPTLEINYFKVIIDLEPDQCGILIAMCSKFSIYRSTDNDDGSWYKESFKILN